MMDLKLDNNLEIWQCPTCDKVCSSKRALKDHKRNHGEKRIACSQCAYRCRTRWSLAVHSRAHTGIKYRCSECSYEAAQLDTVRAHVRLHTHAAQLQCPCCEYVCVDRRSLRKHVLTHSISGDETPFRCQQCGAGFKKRARLTVHLRMHEPDHTMYTCHECGYACAHKSSLVRHMSLHTGEKSGLRNSEEGEVSEENNVVIVSPYENNCTNSETDGGMKDIESEASPSLCDKLNLVECQCEAVPCVCLTASGMISLDRSQLLPYQVGHSIFHSIEKEETVQEEEDASCLVEVNLDLEDDHCKIENNTPTIKMETLTEEYDDLATPSTNVKKDSVEKAEELNNSLNEAKPHMCPDCPFRTAFIGNLRRHARTHNKEIVGTNNSKQFQCPVCEYSAYHRSQLAVHARVHTGEKPYACSFCSYRSNHSSHVTAHKRVHTGERPYACTLCAFCAARRNVLVRHMRTHAGDKAYQCPHCSCGFGSHVNLKTHLKTHELLNDPKSDV